MPHTNIRLQVARLHSRLARFTNRSLTMHMHYPAVNKTVTFSSTSTTDCLLNFFTEKFSILKESIFSPWLACMSWTAATSTSRNIAPRLGILLQPTLSLYVYLLLSEINVSLSAAKTRDSTRKITRSRERARRHTAHVIFVQAPPSLLPPFGPCTYVCCTVLG